MATLTAQTIDRSGLNPALAAAAGGGDEFVNTGAEFIEIKNDDGTATTLTIVTQKTVDGLAVADRTVNIPNGERRLIGPFPKNGEYNDVDDKVQLTYSKVTSLTIGIFSF